MELPPFPPGLERLETVAPTFLLPAVLLTADAAEPDGRTRLGGRPQLPPSEPWPQVGDRLLFYLLQVDLAEAAPHDSSGLLPADGVLTFFYDLEKEPWGYDPAHAGGWRVLHTPATVPVEPRELPDPRHTLPEIRLGFQSAATFPHMGSRSFKELDEKIQLEEAEISPYIQYVDALGISDRNGKNTIRHRMLGHSSNIQGDMQLEAQLVSHGIYCGDPSGYQSARGLELAPGADDWLLLLQFDSDDRAGIMWGDTGMLYFWIRRQDLAARNFDAVWVVLQCY